MKTISISEIEQIGEILDYVHDRYFDLDKVNFDKEKKILSIPLTIVLEDKIKEEKKYFIVSTWRNPIVEAELIFKNVTGFTIEDKAEIGEADINTIYQEGEQLIIKCGIPVIIKLSVTSCEIECVASDKVIDEVKRFDIALSAEN